MNAATYHIGVDGGGTGTRVRLCLPDGTVLGLGQAGPSALGQGAASAWRQILVAIDQALQDAVWRGHGRLAGVTCDAGFHQRCAIGLGLSGAENTRWVAEFERCAPAFAHTSLASDGVTAVLGAHGGHPGALVSVGTGCVGVARHADGTHAIIGGWGWQLGDEGSGAWLGRQAVQHTQHALDGREPAGALAQAVRTHCGQHRAALLDWCATAGQRDFAGLAPLVFAMESRDPIAAALVVSAIQAIEDIVIALDPQGQLPLVVSGSIGLLLQHRMRPELLERSVLPMGDACDGALRLLRQSLVRASAHASPGASTGSQQLALTQTETTSP